MADPKFVTDARRKLGGRLAALRKAAGFNQETFAPCTLYGRSTVANVETGRQRVQREFWQKCDETLNTGGLLTAEHDRIERMRSEHVRGQVLQAAGRPGGVDLDVLSAGPLQLPTAETLRQSPIIAMPSGRYFSGNDLDVRIFPAIDDGRILTQVPTGFASDPIVQRPRRGLIIGATAGDNGGQQHYGMDSRHVRRRLAAGPNVRLMIPKSYLLDSVTVGMLWAVTALDETLLNDDQLIEESRQLLERFEGLPRSAASRSTVNELAAVSSMWLGSDFCARHILRHISEVTDVPAFWTREQRGEEASAWLLFAHKYQYLQQLATRFPEGMTRAFCVPEDLVIASPAAERVLMLLVMALMESFAIRCLLTTEAEYGAVDGFVLDGGRQAIVANWLGGDGIWSVDITSSRPTVREYADAHAHVREHPAMTGDDPARRLQAVASYLGLDWHTITTRSAQLAEYGLAGLAAPRSRLLSLAGAERACQFLGSLAHHTR